MIQYISSVKVIIKTMLIIFTTMCLTKYIKIINPKIFIISTLYCLLICCDNLINIIRNRNYFDIIHIILFIIYTMFIAYLVFMFSLITL